MKLFRDVAFFVFAGVLVAVYALSANGFPLDDSWIHQVYGRNLAQLGQWAFIPNEPSGASTAPLYTLLLAIGYALNIPYAFWTHLLGALALAGAGMIGGRMADRIYPQSNIMGWVTGGALIGAWHLIWSGASGMETMLFCTLLLMAVFLTWREMDDVREMTMRPVMVRGAMFGMVMALATATRPEAILLAGIMGGAMLLAHPHPQFQKTVLWGVGAFGAFLLVISPYLLLNLSLNGSPLPNTSDAKYAQIQPLLRVPYLTRLWAMIQPILAGAQVFCLLGVVYYALIVRKHGRIAWLYLAPLAWSVGLILLYAFRLPVYFQHGRYLIPSLPFIIAFGAIGIGAMVLEWRESMIGRVLSRSLALATIATWGAFIGIGVGVFQTDVAITNEEMVDLAHWIAENLPAEELLAIHDIGAVGYFAPRPMLDIAGLISPEVIPLIGQAEPLWALMQERGAVYLMAFPNQIPNDNPRDSRLCFLYQSEGQTVPNMGEAKMSIYKLNWEGSGC